MLLLTAALSLPLIINVHSLKIYDDLYNGISSSDQGLIIVAAFKLVLMNSSRALPIYMSIFGLVEIAHKVTGSEKERVLYSVLALASIPLIYTLIDQIYGVRYNFGMPAYITITAIFIFMRSEWAHVKLLEKSMFIALLLLGVQWLDIIPSLSQYGFGRGEVSSDVKSIAEVIEATNALTFSAIIFFIIFSMNALLVLKIISDQNKMAVTAQSQKEMEKALVEARIQGLKTRSYEEQQHLVHDLKSPLTSIQALVSVSEMMVEEPKVKDYMHRVSNSVDQLNIMISEILNENKQQVIGIEELFSGILSQLSAIEHSELVHYSSEDNSIKLSVNKIRFSRMIVNIVNNSLAAVSPTEGVVEIKISCSTDKAIIVISDNGSGIPPESMNQIWEKGYSTKESFGLGLTYIQSVVENHKGQIEMTSEVNVGTTTRLYLPLY